MALWVGTSGFSYPEWRGRFYPARLPVAQMLPFYAERFASVEINNTFYRMPNEAMLRGWRRATGEDFRFSLKAPQQITHRARLRDCASAVQRFLQVTGTLGERLGTLLFQLPPYLRREAALLEAFVRELPAGTRAAFEFRHTSWFDAQIFGLLEAGGFALCVSDSAKLSTPVQVTAGYAYFRLRDEGYTPEDLVRWAQIIRAATARCEAVFVYFKHEASGTGPQFAQLFLDAWQGAAPSGV